MKYTVQTTKYIFKNFFYILPFALIPAFFLSMAVAEEEVETIVRAIVEQDFSTWTFVNLFCAVSVLNFGSPESIFTGLVGIILMVPCVALLMAFLDKHLRFGKRTFNGLLSKLNDNFISTFGYIVFFLLIYEVWALILSAVLFLVALIPNTIAVYICAGVIFLAMHVLLLYAVGTIYLWLPCMQITGFPAVEALQYSYQLVVHVKWRILVGQIIALIATEAVIVACALYLPDLPVSFVCSTLLFTILLSFYCVRMMIAYFDRDHIDRADLRKYY